MINEVFYWTGLIVWLIFALLLLIVAGGLVCGLARSISLHRWSYACMKRYGGKPKWYFLPLSVIISAWDLSGYGEENRTVRYYNDEHGAAWRGIGDWNT